MSAVRPRRRLPPGGPLLGMVWVAVAALLLAAVGAVGAFVVAVVF